MPSSPKVRVAIIGYGLIGPKHANAVLSNDNMDLVAIVDPAPQTIDKARHLGVPCYSTIARLLQSSSSSSSSPTATSLPPPPPVDAAIICTPNDTHTTTALELASAGIHILIEKPFCTDTKSGQEAALALDALSREKGIRSLVGHHRRFHPSAATAQRVISAQQGGGSGSGIGIGIGRPVAITMTWALRKPDSYFEKAPWRKVAGPVMVNLVHDIDLCHYFLGPVARVQTEPIAPQRGGGGGGGGGGRGQRPDEGCVLTLKFREGGVVGTALVCDNVPSPFAFESGTGENEETIAKHPGGHDFYRIFGTRGTLSVSDRVALWSYGGGGKQELDDDDDKEDHWGNPLTRSEIDDDDDDDDDDGGGSGGKSPFQRQLDHFVRVIRGQEEPSCTAKAGLAAVKVCEAIKESLRSGGAVEVDEYEL